MDVLHQYPKKSQNTTQSSRPTKKGRSFKGHAACPFFFGSPSLFAPTILFILDIPTTPHSAPGDEARDAPEALALGRQLRSLAHLFFLFLKGLCFAREESCRSVGWSLLHFFAKRRGRRRHSISCSSSKVDSMIAGLVGPLFTLPGLSVLSVFNHDLTRRHRPVGTCGRSSS